MRYINKNDRVPTGELFTQGDKVRGEVETGNTIIRKLQKKFEVTIFSELIGTKISIPRNTAADDSFIIVGIDPTVDQMTVKPINSGEEQKLKITELLSKPFTYEKMDNTSEPTK